jgi:PleD family two-component response regulator
VDEAKAVLSALRGATAAGDEGSVSGVSLTMGAMTFEEPPASVDALVSLADALMYRGKAEGKNRTISDVWRATEQSSDV